MRSESLSNKLPGIHLQGLASFFWMHGLLLDPIRHQWLLRMIKDE